MRPVVTDLRTKRTKQMIDKWVETGANVCDRTIGNGLKKCNLLTEKPNKCH